MSKKKQDPFIGGVLSSFGFGFEVFKSLAHAVMNEGGSSDQLRRLINEPELVTSVAKLITSSSSGIERPLRPGEVCIDVRYEVSSDCWPLPEICFSESEKVIGGKGEKIKLNPEDFKSCRDMMLDICEDSEGHRIQEGAWELHSSVPLATQQISGKRVFAVLDQFDVGTTCEHALKLMRARGYRPATHIELIFYAYACSSALRESRLCLIALGSVRLEEYGEELTPIKPLRRALLSFKEEEDFTEEDGYPEDLWLESYRSYDDLLSYSYLMVRE